MAYKDDIENFHELGYDLGDIKLEKVNTVEQYEQECEVYDLEVDEIHNYETEVGLAHNGGGRL
jgi:hypothetical protein